MRIGFVLAIVFVFCGEMLKQVQHDRGVCFGQIWVARYNGPGDSSDVASAIAVDGTGNVYVTGKSKGSGTRWDYATVKYNSANGDTVWVRRYNGPVNGSDVASAVAVDGVGNVYVTGASYGGSGTDWDYATVKYNSSGIEQWMARYNGPGNSRDEAHAIAVDGEYVYVTGQSLDPGTNYDYATVKYNSSGDSQWVARYNGPGNGYDEAYAIAVDGASNVYVTGVSYGSVTYYDYATVKYKSSGDSLWVARYNGLGDSTDYAYAIAVDGAGNVYVTGWSLGSGTYSDYATVKYNSLGVEQWVARYNGPGNGWDEAYAIAVDGAGNVYVTGMIYGGSGTSYDYATLKYNFSTGDTVWARRYNGPANGWDEAYAIVVDGVGNVYVTGASYGGSGTDWDYATVKYNSQGVEQWVKRYNGPGNSRDVASAIAVDGEYVYVTGWSVGSSGTSSEDYATIKYSSVGVEEQDVRSKTQETRLEVYPNPAFGNALIKYGLPKKTDITLKLYDISGRLVNTIYSGTQEKGEYEVELSGQHHGHGEHISDLSGLPTGIYFIRLEVLIGRDFASSTGELKATKKLTILK